VPTEILLTQNAIYLHNQIVKEPSSTEVENLPVIDFDEQGPTIRAKQTARSK
jgi:hypothetical protein